MKSPDEPSENVYSLTKVSVAVEELSFAAFQNGAQTSSVRISVTVWDRSMIFLFVSKVSARPNYFEGRSQGQSHAKITSGLAAKIHKNACKTVIFHRNSTKFEMHFPSDLGCITLQFF